MGPALLELADIAPGFLVEGVPNGAEDLVNISHATSAAPPGSVPRDAVVLIDDQIKPWHGTDPVAGLKDRGPHATAAHDLNGTLALLL